MGFPVNFHISHCTSLPNLPLPPPLPQAVPAIAQSAGDSSARPFRRLGWRKLGDHTDLLPIKIVFANDIVPKDIEGM